MEAGLCSCSPTVRVLKQEEVELKKEFIKIVLSTIAAQMIVCILVPCIAAPLSQPMTLFPVHSAPYSPEPADSPEHGAAAGQLPYSSGVSTAKSTKLKIIDISHYDMVTNWNSVHQSVDGVYIKATENTTVIDSKFKENSSGAAKVSLPMGFYHYFWPTTDANNARQQARFFYNTIKDYSYRLIPAVDVEITNGQNAATVCNDILAFEQEFQRLTGNRAMIYSNLNFANTYLIDKRLSAYQFWVAYYNPSSPGSTAVWKSYDAWQYHNAGSVQGISTAVDINVANDNIFLN